MKADSGMSEEKAAEKIQASFRGYKTRKSLKNNGVLPPPSNGEALQEVPENPAEESAEASKPTPATPAANTEDELLDIDLTDKDLEKAATKIQASYRNFTARKKQPAEEPDPPKEPEKVEESNGTPAEKANNQEEEEVDIDLEDPEVKKAALKIQSTFRGYKTRKVVEPLLQNGDKDEH